MNWFTWRLHRKQFMIFGVLLALSAALLIPTGIHFWHAYQSALQTCVQNPATPSCSDLPGSLMQSQVDVLIRTTVFAIGLGTPLLLGLFLGSPLIAKEYEEGTNKLVWTQSVSRRKWLTTQLAWALMFAALYGLAVTLLTTWWSHTTNTLYLNRFHTGLFMEQGIVPVAYSVFFTSLGFALSACFRKTLLALGITFALFVVFQTTFSQVIRPRYMAPIAVTAPMGPGAIDEKIPKDAAWVLTRNIIDKNGKSFDSFDVQNMPPECQQIIQNAQTSDGGHAVRVKSAGGRDSLDDCLNQAGIHQTATYQPSYRYWDFQRIEAGIYLGMTLLAVGATYWFVLKRDA
ncbi:MAG TPA: ABC transporter permease subunit [Patescibacteria group bacterium]|nr:ABC transporter permease subunit [Patescibacteria group bacterium]